MKEVTIELSRVLPDRRMLARNLKDILRFAGEVPAAADEVWQRFRGNDDGEHRFWEGTTLPGSWVFRATQTDKGTMLNFWSDSPQTYVSYSYGWGRRRQRVRDGRPIGTRVRVLVTDETVHLLETCHYGTSGLSCMLAMLGVRGALETPYGWQPGGWLPLDLSTYTAVDRWKYRWRRKADPTPKPWEPELMKCAYWRSFSESDSIARDLQRTGESRQVAHVFADHKLVKELTTGKLTTTQKEVVMLLGGPGSTQLVDYLTPEHMDILSTLEITKPDLRIKAAALLKDPSHKGWGRTHFLFKLKDSS